MTLEGASFKLRLEDYKIGRGLSSEIVTIERLETAVLNVTFHVNNAIVLLQLREILQQEAVDYGVQAVLYTRGFLGYQEAQGRQRRGVSSSRILWSSTRLVESRSVVTRRSSVTRRAHERRAPE